jgi:hypothetical protein
MIALAYVLKMDKVDWIMVMNIIHQLFENDINIFWKLVLSGPALIILICGSNHWFGFVICIQGLIFNTWMYVMKDFGLNKDNGSC